MSRSTRSDMQLPMKMAPTPTGERYEFLDVLRGAALFGIVSANMILYSLCFLLGFCIGRHEIHRKLELYRPVARRIAIWGIAIGLPLNVIYASWRVIP